MATERLLMRKAQEILRMKLKLGFSNREAARSVGVSPATVVNVMRRAAEAGLHAYADVEALREDELAARAAQPPTPGRIAASNRCSGIASTSCPSRTSPTQPTLRSSTRTCAGATTT